MYYISQLSSDNWATFLGLSVKLYKKCLKWKHMGFFFHIFKFPLQMDSLCEWQPLFNPVPEKATYPCSSCLWILMPRNKTIVFLSLEYWNSWRKKSNKTQLTHNVSVSKVNLKVSCEQAADLLAVILFVFF